MNFSSTGGIFLRLDPNGNPTIFDQAGNVDAKILGGAFSLKGNVGTPIANSPIGSTTSTSFVSSGLGVVFTPQIVGRGLVICELTVSNSVAGDGTQVSLWLNTGGTILSGGTAQTGTNLTVINGALFTSAGANGKGVITLANLPSLTVGTQYTITVAFQAVTGGTAFLTIENNHPVMFEI